MSEIWMNLSGLFLITNELHVSLRRAMVMKRVMTYKFKNKSITTRLTTDIFSSPLTRVSPVNFKYCAAREFRCIVERCISACLVLSDKTNILQLILNFLRFRTS
jgi:hypothetical protein